MVTDVQYIYFRYFHMLKYCKFAKCTENKGYFKALGVRKF
jgi:hypothetical protein